jgi:biopolymer transport protein ExbD
MGVSLQNGPGSRKAVDAAINLVPFIDLLSCCISFLLITAVWTQLSRIDVAPAGAQTGVDPPQLTLTVYIDKDGYRLETGAQSESARDRSGLAELLRATKSAHPDKDDIQVRADDSISYREIVATMDVILSANFPLIAIGETGGS